MLSTLSSPHWSKEKEKSVNKRKLGVGWEWGGSNSDPRGDWHLNKQKFWLWCQHSDEECEVKHQVFDVAPSTNVGGGQGPVPARC